MQRNGGMIIPIVDVKTEAQKDWGRVSGLVLSWLEQPQSLVHLEETRGMPGMLGNMALGIGAWQYLAFFR